MLLAQGPVCGAPPGQLKAAAWRDVYGGWESWQAAWDEAHVMVLCQPSKMWVRIKGSSCPGMKQPFEWGI